MGVLKTLRTISLSVLLLLTASRIDIAKELGATSEPIKLAMLEWTGQHVTTHIAGNILESMGYNVEYETARNIPQCQQDRRTHWLPSLSQRSLLTSPSL